MVNSLSKGDYLKSVWFPKQRGALKTPTNPQSERRGGVMPWGDLFKIWSVIERPGAVNEFRKGSTRSC